MFYSLEININKLVLIILYCKFYYVIKMCDYNMWDVFYFL